MAIFSTFTIILLETYLEASSGDVINVLRSMPVTARIVYDRETYLDWLLKEEYISYHEDYVAQEEQLTFQLKSLEAKLTKEQPLEIKERPEVKKFLENKDIPILSREVVLEMIDCVKVHENQKISIAYNLPEEVSSLFSATYVADN